MKQMKRIVDNFFVAFDFNKKLTLTYLILLSTINMLNLTGVSGTSSGTMVTIVVRRYHMLYAGTKSL